MFVFDFKKVESQLIVTGNKTERYEALIPQLKALIASETDQVANYANISAVLKECFGFFWVGFYRVIENELVLGPFQGPIACTRIAFGKGVCGKAWQEGKTIVVPDVDKFPGHIACSSQTKSEIVVPVCINGKVIAVLDVDSDLYDNFDALDIKYLGLICGLLS
ncbi:MAG: GAF domain-containing protein [Flavobacteriia bacterium]|nr:GAF domain-containing protein [Flavobacteriia bacterium]